MICANCSAVRPAARTALLRFSFAIPTVILCHPESSSTFSAAADALQAYTSSTDTTHVIIGDHTTREGSYLALTRAERDTGHWHLLITAGAGEHAALITQSRPSAGRRAGPELQPYR